MAVDKINFNSSKLSLNVGSKGTTLEQAQAASLRNNSIFTLAAAKNGKDSNGMSAQASDTAESKGFSVTSLLTATTDGRKSTGSAGTAEGKTATDGQTVQKNTTILRQDKVAATKEGNAFKKTSELDNKRLTALTQKVEKKNDEIQSDVSELESLGAAEPAAPAATPGAPTEPTAPAANSGNPFAQGTDDKQTSSAQNKTPGQPQTASAADPNDGKRAELSDKIAGGQDDLQGLDKNIKTISKSNNTSKAKLQKTLAGFDKKGKTIEAQTDKHQKAAEATVKAGEITSTVGTGVTGIATAGHATAAALSSNTATLSAGTALEGYSQTGDKVGNATSAAGSSAKATGYAVEGKTKEAAFASVEASASCAGAAAAGVKGSKATQAYVKLGQLSVNQGINIANKKS